MREKRLHRVLTVLVFLLFAFATLLVLLTSGGVYQRLVEGGQARHHRFTAAQYLTTRIHQSQGATVEEQGELWVLALEETIDQEPYLTRIYLHEGYLYEVFTPARTPFRPEDGEKLFPARVFHPEKTGDLLTIALEEDTLYLHLPAEAA